MKEFIQVSEKEIYYGELDASGKHYDGVGLKQYPNGEMYYGNWKKGVFEGYGAYVYYDGRIRICNWADNKPTDEGIILKPEGDPFSIYWGSSENSKPKHGIGLHKDGKIFYGTWTEWKGELFSGKGTFSWPDGRIYSGYWKNSRQDNGGVIVRPDGTVIGDLEKETSADKTLILKNDSNRVMFYGRYRDESVRNGKGVMYYTDRSIYSGEFVNGSREGLGFYKYLDGSIYIGEWRKDDANGRGMLYSPHNGRELYVGSFANGVFNGDGCVFAVSTSGISVKNCGEWSNGAQITDWKTEIVKPEPEPEPEDKSYEFTLPEEKPAPIVLPRPVEPEPEPEDKSYEFTLPEEKPAPIVLPRPLEPVPAPEPKKEPVDAPIFKDRPDEETDNVNRYPEEEKGINVKAILAVVIAVALIVVGYGVYYYLEDNLYTIPDEVTYTYPEYDTSEDEDSKEDTDMSSDQADSDLNSETSEETIQNSLATNLSNGERYNLDSFTRSGYSMVYDDENYYSRLGIDVSYYQGSIDWQKVKNAGIEFAYIRLGFRGYGSEGTINLDSTFEENIRNAQAAGIDVGVYFFSQAINEEEAREEAEFILQNIAPYDVTLPIAIEAVNKVGDSGRTNNLSEDQVSKDIMAFCDAIVAAGYEPAIAFDKARWNEYNSVFEGLGNYTFWYGDYELSSPPPFQCEYLQFANNGNVPGIGTNVDMDIQFLRK